MTVKVFTLQLLCLRLAFNYGIGNTITVGSLHLTPAFYADRLTNSNFAFRLKKIMKAKKVMRITGLLMRFFILFFPSSKLSTCWTAHNFIGFTAYMHCYLVLVNFHTR